jgi:hypothetical protein
MKLFIICLFAIASTCLGETREEYFNRVTEAIGRAENSKTHPFGVKSIATKGDVVLARKICLQSVRNNFARWEKAGKPIDFISFMSKRYCPVGAKDDPTGLNRNWSRNVNYFLNK